MGRRPKGMDSLGKKFLPEVRKRFAARLEGHHVSDIVRAGREFGVPLEIYEEPTFFTQFEGDNRLHLSARCGPSNVRRWEIRQQWDAYPAEVFCDTCARPGSFPGFMMAELCQILVCADFAREFQDLQREVLRGGKRWKFRKAQPVQSFTVADWEKASTTHTAQLVTLANQIEALLLLEAYDEQQARTGAWSGGRETLWLSPVRFDWLEHLVEQVEAATEVAQGVSPYRYSEVIGEVEAAFLEKSLTDPQPDTRLVGVPGLTDFSLRRENSALWGRFQRAWVTWSRTMRETGKAKLAEKRAIHAWVWEERHPSQTEIAQMVTQCETWRKHYFEELRNSPAYVGEVPYDILRNRRLSDIRKAFVSQVLLEIQGGRGILIIAPKVFFNYITGGVRGSTYQNIAPLAPTDTGQTLTTAAMLLENEKNMEAALTAARAVADAPD